MTMEYLEYGVEVDYVPSIICPTRSIVSFEEVQTKSIQYSGGARARCWVLGAGKSGV